MAGLVRSVPLTWSEPGTIASIDTDHDADEPRDRAREPRSPVDDLLDVFVYAPLGLLVDGPRRFPEFAARGRDQVASARIIGQLAAQVAQRRVEAVTGDLGGTLTRLCEAFGGQVPEPVVTDTTATVVPTDGRDEPEPVPIDRGSPADDGQVGPDGAEVDDARDEVDFAGDSEIPPVHRLAIPDYDSLAASQVVKRLAGLEIDELVQVQRYEAAKRGRRTILSKIEKLTS